MLATFALLQLDAGERSAAQSLLEAAVASSVDRPRVYFELAKLRYEDALNRSHRNDGKIEASDLAGIVDLLTVAAKKAPPMLGVYELLAGVWTNAAMEPDGAQLAVLAEGLALLASESVLQYRAGVLYQKLGDITRADALAREALRYAQPRLASEVREFREKLAVAPRR